MTLVDSLYINNSGGKVLLNFLVERLELNKASVFYLFDFRCKNDFQDIPDERKLYLKATVKNRYRFYEQNHKKYKKIFCFGNIPPPVKQKEALVYTYFHNVSILSQPDNYSLKEQIIKQIKRLYIKLLKKNTDFFIVQTAFVKTNLIDKLNVSEEKVLTMPFFRQVKPPKNIEKKSGSFVYISNGNTHKNHFNLLKAWEILADQGLYPELHLTVTDNFKNIILEIEKLTQRGLNIINHGYCDPEFLYEKCEFLIYPSLIESFGLGLIEAAQYDCKIIASDLDYVYEVVEPSEVFHPLDADSIAVKVKKVLSHENKPTSIKMENKINEIIALLK